jgi:hypothetical protein
MSEMKRCPFCGEPADDRYQSLTKCRNDKCLMNEWDDTLFYLDKEWNNRPIEDALNARIAELEDAQRWTPVSERLPLLRDSKAVLVYTKSGETYSGLYLGNNEWTGLLHDFREGEVTHWMPLPSAPESEDE